MFIVTIALVCGLMWMGVSGGVLTTLISGGESVMFLLVYYLDYIGVGSVCGNCKKDQDLQRKAQK